jgi:hypothetical protein
MEAYLILGAACTVTGGILGVVVAMTYTAAAISHSQERMQRKVLQAQAEARYYQAMADRVSLALHGFPYPDEKQEYLMGPWFR